VPDREVLAFAVANSGFSCRTTGAIFFFFIGAGPRTSRAQGLCIGAAF
jgi:hypothetical protein